MDIVFYFPFRWLASSPIQPTCTAWMKQSALPSVSPIHITIIQKRFCVDDKARGPLVFQISTFLAILNTSFSLSPPNNRSEVPVVTPLPKMPLLSISTNIAYHRPRPPPIAVAYALVSAYQILFNQASIPGLGKLQHRPNLAHCLFL